MNRFRAWLSWLWSWVNFFYSETAAIIRTAWYIVSHAHYNLYMLIRLGVFFLGYFIFLDRIVVNFTSGPAMSSLIWTSVHLGVYFILGAFMAVATEFTYQVLHELSELVVARTVPQEAPRNENEPAGRTQAA